LSPTLPQKPSTLARLRFEKSGQLIAPPLPTLLISILVLLPVLATSWAEVRSSI
jgi:hypothetical protein